MSQDSPRAKTRTQSRGRTPTRRESTKTRAKAGGKEVSLNLEEVMKASTLKSDDEPEIKAKVRGMSVDEHRRAFEKALIESQMREEENILWPMPGVPYFEKDCPEKVYKEAMEELQTLPAEDLKLKRDKGWRKFLCKLLETAEEKKLSYRQITTMILHHINDEAFRRGIDYDIKAMGLPDSIDMFSKTFCSHPTWEGAMEDFRKWQLDTSNVSLSLYHFRHLTISTAPPMSPEAQEIYLATMLLSKLPERLGKRVVSFLQLSPHLSRTNYKDVAKTITFQAKQMKREVRVYQMDATQ